MNVIFNAPQFSIQDKTLTKLTCSTLTMVVGWLGLTTLEMKGEYKAQPLVQNWKVSGGSILMFLESHGKMTITH